MEIKKTLKIISLIIIMSFIVLTGCSKQKASVSKMNDDSEKVTLKWLIGGPGKQADSNIVWEEFNKELGKVMPNTSVEIEPIAIADYAEKWKLIAASGENIDIAWNGWMIPFDDEVRKGSYMPLDDLLEKYAPDIKGSMPDWVWQNVKVDGKIYAIPNYQMMVNQPLALRTPKELADKYLDSERVEKAFANWKNSSEEIMTDECFDALDEYLSKLKKDNKIGLGISPEFSDWLAYGNANNKIVANAYVDYKNGSYKVKSLLDLPERFVERMSGFFNKGYIRKDVLTVKDYKKDLGKPEGYVLWSHYYDKYTEQSESIRYNMPIKIIPVSTKATTPIVASSTNTAISRTSKNPVRTMKLLNLINSEKGKNLYNILVYGLEGIHYKKISDNRIETIGYVATPTLDSRYGINKWIIGNTFNAYDTQAEINGYNDYIKNEVNNSAEVSPLAGFKLNTDKIKVELAQYNNVKNEFKMLATGAYSNYKEMINQRNTKFKNAGADRIVIEVQSQIDEWIKNKSNK